MSTHYKSGEFFALTAAVFWGLNYPFIKMVLQYIQPEQFIFLRYAIAVAVFYIYLRLTGNNFTVKREHVRQILFLGMFGVGVYNIVWTAGLAQIAASDSALLMSTSPILTGIFAMISGSEKITLRKWTGTLVAFGGIYSIISHAPGFQLRFDSEILIGDILTLCSALLFAFYTIRAKPLLQHYGPVKLTALTMAAGLPLLFGAAIWKGSLLIYPVMEPTLWGAFWYISLIGTNLCFAFWYKGVKDTTPFQTIIFHFIVPVGSMISGAVLLGEAWSLGRILGGFLVFAGLLLIKFEEFSHVTSKVAGAVKH